MKAHTNRLNPPTYSVTVACINAAVKCDWVRNSALTAGLQIDAINDAVEAQTISVSVNAQDQGKLDQWIGQITQKDPNIAVFHEASHPLHKAGICRPFYRLSKDLTPANGISLQTIKQQIANRASSNNTGGSAPLAVYTAPQMASIYGCVPQNRKKVIAVISLGGQLPMDSLQTYWVEICNLSPATFPTVIIVDGYANPSDPDYGDIENQIDVEVATSFCVSPSIDNTTQTTILFVSGTNTYSGFYNAIYRAANYSIKPDVISISWGDSETHWPPAYLNAYNALFQTIQSKGINICVASGDHGSFDDQTINIPSANFPASSPWVTSVGGTHLVCSGDTYVQTTIETVWNDAAFGITDGYATGGALSVVFNKDTSYQRGHLPKNYGTNRAVPDISMNAATDTPWVIALSFPNTPIYLYLISGTSCSTPAIAAIFANSGIKSFANPALYKALDGSVTATQSCFHDITAGYNGPTATGPYSAGIGYDLCSGVGTPNGATLIPYLSNF